MLDRGVAAASPAEILVENPAYIKYEIQNMYSI